MKLHRLKEIDICNEARKDWMKAEAEWESAFDSGDIERLKAAMSVCQAKIQKLLKIEAKIRQKKIDEIPYNQSDPQNIQIEKNRQIMLQVVEEIRKKYGSD